jgi:hypothetical protein
MRIQVTLSTPFRPVYLPYWTALRFSTNPKIAGGCSLDDRFALVVAGTLALLPEETVDSNGRLELAG